MTQLIRRIIGAALLGSVALASAQVNSGSDGSDGAFNPSATDTTVNLALATTTAWNLPGGGNGVYDAAKWAVVFKYSSVNIAAGKTVRFANHPKNPPVVWLVQGDVTINGTLVLDAVSSQYSGPSTPGPGGFRGGINDALGLTKGAGLGPGGSSNVNGYSSEGASFGSVPSAGSPSGMGPIYGNPQILPLIGGSGSKSHPDATVHGGSGGGAILIVASGTVTVNGTIQARSSVRYWQSPQNCGSGGAIRIIGNEILGSGFLNTLADTGFGGNGRIRLERLNASSSFGGTTSPAASTAVLAAPDPTIWPTSTHPRLAVSSVDGIAVPADPSSDFVSPDLHVGPAAANIVRLEAANVPTDGTWRVQVRIVPRSGPDQFANATLVSGNLIASIWEASVVLPPGGSAVIARAYKL